MERWNPWRDLRERADVELHFDRLADRAGGGIYVRLGDRRAIFLSPSLGRRERSASLAHELVHDERQITAPDACEATMEREEHIVRAVVAQRMVPLDELAGLVAVRGEIGPMMAWEIADHFDVTEEVAVEAVRQLQAKMLEAEVRRETAPPVSQATASPQQPAR